MTLTSADSERLTGELCGKPKPAIHVPTQTIGYKESPISQLPAEILELIFDHTVARSTDDEVRHEDVIGPHFFDVIHPVAIASVCRSWRQVALDDTSLWARWFITISCSAIQPLRYLGHFVSRALKKSGSSKLQCSIDVTLKCGEHWHDSESLGSLLGAYWNVISDLLEHQSRWMNVSLFLQTKSFDPHQLRPRSNPEPVRLFTSKLQFLRELHIDFQHECPVQVERHPSNIIIQARPSQLRNLEIRMCSVTQLEVMERDWFGDLVSLSLNIWLPSDEYKKYCRDYPSPGTPLKAPLVMKNLRALLLTGLSLHPLFILDRVTLPRLEYMVIYDWNLTSYMQAMTNVVRRSACQIHTLAIKAGVSLLNQEPLEHLKDFLEVMRSVKDFQLLALDIPELFPQTVTALSLSSEGGSMRYLQSLQHLSLFGTMSRAAIVDIARARMNVKERTLQSITLTGCQTDPSAIHMGRIHRYPEDESKYWAEMEEFVAAGLRFTSM